MKIPWAEVLADVLTGNPKGSRSYCPFIISNERRFCKMARRDIQKNIEEGRQFLRENRRRAAVIDLSILELKYFVERIQSGEHPMESLCDMFCFAFAVGYRAGVRKNGKAAVDTSRSCAKR